MSSYRQGKPEVKFWLAQHLSNGSEVLDVGACDGVWSNILSEWYTMDASLTVLYRTSTTNTMTSYSSEMS